MVGERLKGLAAWAGVATVTTGVVGGLAVASEKSGFTDALLTYDWALKSIYHEAHNDMPLLVWADYGNPGAREDYVNNGVNRVMGSIGGGIVGSVNLLAIAGCIGLGIEDRRNRRLQVEYSRQDS